MIWLAATMLVINALLAPVAIFVLFPACQRSVFRYKLWALRDELWDAAYESDIADDHHVLALKERIEDSICSADSLTARRILPLIAAVETTRPELARKAVERARATLHDGHRIERPAIVTEVEIKYAALLVNYTTRSSLAGFILRITVAFYVLMQQRFRIGVSHPTSASRVHSHADRELAIRARVTTVVIALERRDPSSKELSSCLN